MTDPNKINTLVAERVMGWKLQEELGIRYADGSESWGQSPEYTAQKCQNYQRQGLGCTLIKRQIVGDFDPTTDMNHAMEVAAMLTTTHGCIIAWLESESVWQVCFTPPDAPVVTERIGDSRMAEQYRLPIKFRHKWLPLAICLAALKAVGAEVPDA